MKNLSAVSLLMLALAVAVSSSAAVVEKDNGFVSVNSSTSKEISPNQAEITVNIETSDASMQKAANENKIIANKIYSSLKTLINEKNGDYIKTGNYRANPVYTTSKDNKRVFDKYVVSNAVVVKTKNTDLISKIIDTSIAQGATNVNDIQFFATDYDLTCNQILADLTKKAYSQADAVAQAANSRVVGIKSISTTCNAEGGPRPYYKMMAMSAGKDSVSATPIESGKIKIYANIDASFYVK